MWARATRWRRRSSCRRDGPRLLYTPRGLINRFICFLSYEPRCGPRDRLFTDLENLRRAARSRRLKKADPRGPRIVPSPRRRRRAPRALAQTCSWLRARRPSSPAALARKQSEPLTGGAWRSHRGRAGDCADPSRTPGRSVPLGLAPPRHPFVGCRRSVKRAASLPKSRCAPHWESPRRAARPDGSATGRQLRARHKNSDTRGQLHGQPWPTIG